MFEAYAQALPCLRRLHLRLAHGERQIAVGGVFVTFRGCLYDSEGSPFAYQMSCYEEKVQGYAFGFSLFGQVRVLSKRVPNTFPFTVRKKDAELNLI